jgi:hypothetical protein
MVMSSAGLGPENDCAGKGSSSFKRQTQPLVREGSAHQQTHNCLTGIKIWSWAPDGCLTPRQFEFGNLNFLLIMLLVANDTSEMTHRIIFSVLSLFPFVFLTPSLLIFLLACPFYLLTQSLFLSICLSYSH